MNKKQSSFFDFGNPRLLALVIAAASILVYSNTLFNGYNLDDELVTDNHALKGPGNFSTLINLFSQPYYQDAAGNRYEYRPVVMVTFFLEFLIFGKKPGISHFINLLLYACTCLLIFHLLRKLFGNYKYTLFLSFAITLFFAVHPLHTEAVASIKNRDELLSLLLGVSSWIFALNFIDKKSLLHYALYLLCFLAALFSKQTTITLSLLIPASLVLFRNVSLSRYLALVLPIAFIASTFSPIYLLYIKGIVFVGTTVFLLVFYALMAKRGETVQFLKNLGTNVKTVITSRLKYKMIGGIAGIIALLFIGFYLITEQNAQPGEGIGQEQFDLNDRIQDFRELQVGPLLQTPAPSVIPIAGRKLDFVETPLVYVQEAGKKIGTSVYALGYYLKLMVIPYPLRFYYGYNQIPISGFDNAFVIISLLAYLAMLAGIIYLLYKRKHLIAAFGLLFFLLAMIPLSNLLTPIAGVVAERLAFSASLGFCIAFCYFLLYPAINEKAQFFKWTGENAVRYSRIAFFGIVILFAGLSFARNFAWKNHLTLFRADMKHLDNSARAHHLYASHLAYSTIGNSRTPESMKKLQEAVPHFKKTIEIWPEFPYAYFDLAKTYLLMGDMNSAIEAYTKSTQRDTLYAPPYFELGVVLSDVGRQQEAEAAYRKAIKKDSTFTQAYTNLSYLYYTQNRIDESIRINLLAIKHKPNAYEPLVNLGKTYMRMRDNERAIYYFEKAVAVNRSDKGLMNALADLHRAQGNVEKEKYYRNLK